MRVGIIISKQWFTSDIQVSTKENKEKKNIYSHKFRYEQRTLLILENALTDINFFMIMKI